MAKFPLIPLFASGSGYKEQAFLVYQNSGFFRGIIQNDENVISGGSYNDLTGEYIHPEYTGNVTGIRITALKACHMIIYRVEQAPGSQPQIVFDGNVDTAQIAYAGSVNILNYLIVEAE